MVVDSDVIIRFLTNDDLAKAKKFQDALLSKQKFTLTDVTFAEVYWTLRSFYKFTKPKIINCLQALIIMPSIICSRGLLENTLRLLQSRNISFIDAYTASFATVKETGEILSYDRGFDKIPGISRREP